MSAVVSVFTTKLVWGAAMKSIHTLSSVLGSCVLGICLALAPQPLLAKTASPSPRVHVETGDLEGGRDGEAEAFLGVPYAAPPVDDNRWRAPLPARAWQGVREAKIFGASCWQPVNKAGFGPWTHEYVVQDAVSEDCLFLNIWRPVVAKANKPLPVIVWIHGGGFSSGSGSVPIYNGRHLAQKGVVVVTLNYRVGVFGFLAHPELTAEARATGAPPANFGIQDQIAALEWIKRNIANFGGDPTRVTIAGQSAGSMSVHILTVSPMAKGLFHSAIAESGITMPQNDANDLSSAEQIGVALSAANGDLHIADLRRISPDKLKLGAAAGPFYSPVVDGHVLTDTVFHSLQSGHFNDVPMIVGQNSDENVSMAPPSDVASVDEYNRFFKERFGDMAGEFQAHFPADDDVSRGSALRRARLSNGLASIWQWAGARWASRYPAYVYLFRHREPGPLSNQWKSFHSSEITYVFGTMDTAPERNFSEVDRKISQDMSDDWVNFAKSGNPNGAGPNRAGAVLWQPYSTKAAAVLDIGGTSRMKQPLDAALLDSYARFFAKGGTVSLF
jgi:para-nitrobenzyl esterase